MKHQTRALLVVLASLCTGAAAQGSDVSITVFMDHYAVGRRAFSDLEALEREVMTMRPATIQIVACGPSADSGVKAVGHRFRALPLNIIPRHEKEDPCSRPLLTPAGLRAARESTPEDVRRYWESIAP